MDHQGGLNVISGSLPVKEEGRGLRGKKGRVTMEAGQSDGATSQELW